MLAEFLNVSTAESLEAGTGGDRSPKIPVDVRTMNIQSKALLDVFVVTTGVPEVMSIAHRDISFEPAIGPVGEMDMLASSSEKGSFHVGISIFISVARSTS
jgi:hypothetical protein